MQFIKKIIVDEQTFLEYNETMMWRRQRVTLFALTLFMTLLSMFLSGTDQFLLSLGMGVVVAAVFFITSFFIMKSTSRKTAKKVYMKNGLHEMYLQMSMDDKGIIQRYEKEEIPFTWDIIRRMVETDLAFYFYYTSQDALIITKQSLSEDEKKIISQLAKKHLPEKKIKRVASH